MRWVLSRGSTPCQQNSWVHSFGCGMYCVGPWRILRSTSPFLRLPLPPSWSIDRYMIIASPALTKTADFVLIACIQKISMGSVFSWVTALNTPYGQWGRREASKVLPLWRFFRPCPGSRGTLLVWQNVSSMASPTHPPTECTAAAHA